MYGGKPTIYQSLIIRVRVIVLKSLETALQQKGFHRLVALKPFFQPGKLQPGFTPTSTIFTQSMLTLSG